MFFFFILFICKLWTDHAKEKSLGGGCHDACVVGCSEAAQVHISPDAAPSELWDFECSEADLMAASAVPAGAAAGFHLWGLPVCQTDSHKTVWPLCGGGSDLAAHARLFGIHGTRRSFSCCWGLCSTHWLGSIYIVHCDTKQEHGEEENIIRESWERLSEGIRCLRTHH